MMQHVLVLATIVRDSDPVVGRVLRGLIGVLLLVMGVLSLRRYRRRFGRRR